MKIQNTSLQAPLLCQPRRQQDSDNLGVPPLQVHAEIVVTFEVRPTLQASSTMLVPCTPPAITLAPRGHMYS